jgi:cytochrome c oxidase subunit 2
MPIVVEVLAVDEYEAWYAQRLVAEADRVRALSQTFTAAELMTQGEQVYNTFCAACHMPNGRGVPPVFPALDGAASTTGPLDAHLEVVINGQPGTAMQAFGTQLDAAQLAAVVHYERHAWTNNARDITQPQDVVEFISRAQGGNL